MIAQVDAPYADEPTGHGSAPFQQEFFDVLGTQGEAAGEPDGVTNNQGENR
ncbi:hypothetical protein ACFFLM_23695 [Deinococcus oregonensis]|uniref:Uncharacterized protein n=1 Tax=Deinococcus oregonensis TaxID=1805970 RepID=A0ABV6B955_9DEIO